MGRIDTKRWKPFLVGELFLELKTGYVGRGRKIGSAETVKDKEHTVPLTCAKYGNNGIMYYGREGEFLTHKNVLAVIRDGAISTGMVYAQEEETGVYSHSYMIKLKEVEASFYVNRFLACVLTKTIYQKYTRDDACIWPKIAEEQIFLPIDAVGLPDWRYMDNYMRKMEAAAQQTLSLFDTAKNTAPEKHDTTAWKRFQIKNLFHKCEMDCHKTDFNKAMDISTEKTDEFNLPLVNAMHFNNGIMYYGREDDWDAEEMTLDIVSNGAIATGDVFAQPQKTGVLWDAYLVKPYDEVSAWALQFLATAMQKCVKDHFGYDNKCTWNKVKEEYIYLPVDDDGAPDWQYMENCMKRKEERARKTMDCFLA